MSPVQPLGVAANAGSYALTAGIAWLTFPLNKDSVNTLLKSACELGAAYIDFALRVRSRPMRACSLFGWQASTARYSRSALS